MKAPRPTDLTDPRDVADVHDLVFQRSTAACHEEWICRKFVLLIGNMMTNND